MGEDMFSTKHIIGGKVKNIRNNKNEAVTRELLKLLFEEKEDIDFDPADFEGLSLTPILKKMLDPNISPAKYADLDAQLDDSGNPNQQGFALAAFALSYSDGSADSAIQLLKKALTFVPKIEKARASSTATEEDAD